MPNPSSSLATLRPDLGGSMEEFNLVADRAGFIASQALPVFEAPEKSGEFGIIPVEELLKNADTERAPKSGYHRDDFEFEDASYVCKEHGAESVLDDTERKMYRHYFDFEVVGTNRARDKVLRNREKRVANMLFNTANFTNAAGSDWSSPGSATPIDDVEARVLATWAASGLWPNGMILSRELFRKLRQCDQIVERLNANGIRDTAPEKITTAMLSLVFDLPKIMVAGGTKNTSNEGQAATFGGIWRNDYCMVGSFAMSNDIQEPCVGRTFHWSEDGSEIGAAIETYRDETVRSDIVRARQDTDEKVIHAVCAQLLTDLQG